MNAVLRRIPAAVGAFNSHYVQPSALKFLSSTSSGEHFECVSCAGATGTFLHPAASEIPASFLCFQGARKEKQSGGRFLQYSADWEAF